MSYLRDSLDALNELYEGERALVVISEGKSQLAYETAELWARENDYAFETHNLICEDGEHHKHAFVARRHPMIGLAVGLIRDTQRDLLSRESLQRRLGMMFGYNENSIDEFVESEIGQSCACDCCGGAPRSLIPRTDHDADSMRARRTQPWGNG